MTLVNADKHANCLLEGYIEFLGDFPLAKGFVQYKCNKHKETFVLPKNIRVD